MILESIQKERPVPQIPMKFYCKDKAVLALMIELNRRLFMDEKTGKKTAGFVGLQVDVQEVVKTLSKFI